MGKIKQIFSISLLFFVFPLNAENNERKEYSKYDFYSRCLDDASPQRINNGLVWFCSNQAIKKLDILIKSRISSKGKCKERDRSHACTLKESQDAFNQYVDATCKKNKYGLHSIYCEMTLKKDRLKWLDKTPGT
jgi:hypothetical protein